VSFYAHLFAFKDKILGTLAPWESTGAIKKANRYTTFLVLFVAWSSIQICWSLAFIFFRVQDFPYYHFLPTLFFACFNAFIGFQVVKYAIQGGKSAEYRQSTGLEHLAGTLRRFIWR
jgi:hypothetical protein